jgi:DNA-binding Lrp family transcriptional regulator
LGLSINAIHKRIKAMTEEGIIRAYTARISIAAIRAISVWIFGRSEASPLDDVHVELRKDGSTYWVAYSGGGYIYVGGFLPGISKLEQYVAFVKKGAQIVDPTVGIGTQRANSLPFHDEKFSPLDYRIIRVLHKDARKPVSEVATELGITARTVQRRLERMVEKSLLDLSIDWYPDASNDILFRFGLESSYEQR